MTNSDTLSAVAGQENTAIATQNTPPKSQLPTAETRAAHALVRASSHISAAFTTADMVEVLRSVQASDEDGEAALFYQSQVLDALFHRLAAEASEDGLTRREQTYLALRLQRQCRSSLESMAFLKYMKQKKL